MWMRTSVPATRAILTDQRMALRIAPFLAVRKTHRTSRLTLPLAFAIAPAQR